MQRHCLHIVQKREGVTKNGKRLHDDRVPLPKSKSTVIEFYRNTSKHQDPKSIDKILGQLFGGECSCISRFFD